MASAAPSREINQSRISMSAANNIGVKGVSISTNTSSGSNVTKTSSVTPSVSSVDAVDSSDATVAYENCRDAYRACMDEFCLLGESEGERCACSDNINKSKSLIKEIQDIQAQADKLYTEGVEREQLGAKVSLVFGESESAKKVSRASGLSFTEWLNNDDSNDELGTDEDIGDGLYAMAAE